MTAVAAVTPTQGLNLDYMRQQAGGDDIDLSGNNNPFKTGISYPVQVTEQSITTAQKGLSLLKLTVRQIVAPGSAAKPLQTNLLITIPVFSQRAKDNYGQDKLETMRRMNALTLDQLIRAAFPESFTGNVEDAGKIVLGAARMLLKSELQLKGKRFYYGRKPPKDSTKQPFDAFSSKPIDGAPVAS